MQGKLIFVAVLISVFASWAMLNSTAFSEDNEKMAKYYNSCIVKKIKNCNSKVILLSSSESKNLQEYAAIQKLKAKFLEAEKDLLVQEMLELKLEPKHYKVEQFLNSRFFGRTYIIE